MSRYIDAEPRYIDADAFLKSVKQKAYPQSGSVNESERKISLFGIMEILTAMPTVDVVENKVLRLLLDWAIECGFGYDSIPEEYEKYKDDIQDMSYADGLIYIAMKEVEDEHTDSN